MSFNAWWKEVWSWDKVKNSIRSLPGRLGFAKGTELRFFKLRLDLGTGEVFDEILGRYLTERERYGLYYILYQYSHATTEVEETRELLTLSGICPAIHCPMLKENITAFETVFGTSSEFLYYAAEPFGYVKVDVADAAVKIYVLPKIPIVIGIWLGEEGLPPSSLVLFDKNIIHYLECEAASILAGVTLARLIISLARRFNIGIDRVKYSYRYQCAE